jgi:hypothetical protein
VCQQSTKELLVNTQGKAADKEIVMATDKLFSCNTDVISIDSVGLSVRDLNDTAKKNSRSDKECHLRKNWP